MRAKIGMSKVFVDNMTLGYRLQIRLECANPTNLALSYSELKNVILKFNFVILISPKAIRVMNENDVLKSPPPLQKLSENYGFLIIYFMTYLFNS